MTLSPIQSKTQNTQPIDLKNPKTDALDRFKDFAKKKQAAFEAVNPSRDLCEFQAIADLLADAIEDGSMNHQEAESKLSAYLKGNSITIDGSSYRLSNASSYNSCPDDAAKIETEATKMQRKADDTDLDFLIQDREQNQKKMEEAKIQDRQKMAELQAKASLYQKI